MSPTKLTSPKLTGAHEAELKAMAEVIGLDKAPFEVTIAFEGFKGHHARKCYRFAFGVGEPPKAISEMTFLESGEIIIQPVEGAERVSELYSVHLGKFIAH